MIGKDNGGMIVWISLLPYWYYTDHKLQEMEEFFI